MCLNLSQSNSSGRTSPRNPGTISRRRAACSQQTCLRPLPHNIVPMQRIVVQSLNFGLMVSLQLELGTTQSSHSSLRDLGFRSHQGKMATKRPTSSPYPLGTTVESSPSRVFPSFTHPPVTSPTCPSKPLSKPVPSALYIGSRHTTKTDPRTDDSPLPQHAPPVAGSDLVVRRDNCVPGGGEAGERESNVRDDSVW